MALDILYAMWHTKYIKQVSTCSMNYQLLFTRKSGKQVLLPTIFKNRERAIFEANKVVSMDKTFAYYDLLVIQES